ncbi:MAG: hypothetical protein HY586_03740 [Candidatus Omnitrophica bacterium]|nr:hypothetical protein [Candidatus Omnitrophota bacterium]
MANRFHYSLSTVHHALQVPVELGAIRKTSKFFVLQDWRKMLYYWASVRGLSRDILYATFLNVPVGEREGLAIPNSVYAAYTAAKRILKEPPADYDKVYFYVTPGNIPIFKKRFPQPLRKNLPANIFALKMPDEMLRYGPDTTIIQTFVDIWNLSDWYAHDFTQALEEKLNVLLS